MVYQTQPLFISIALVRSRGLTEKGNGKAGSAAKANIGDKREISFPDMVYTCRHRGMKEFKIRRHGMPLSNQLAFPHSTVSPPLYGPTR